MEGKMLEIEEIIYVLKKRGKLIFIFTLLIGCLGAFYAYKNMEVSYTSTIKIFSGKENSADVYTTNDLTTNSTLMETYIQLIKTDNFMNSVIKKSGLSLGVEELKNGVKFTKEGEVPILTIAYSSKDPIIAEKVVSTIAVEFEQEVKETILNINTKVIEDVKVIPIYPNKVKFVVLAFISGLIFSVAIALVKDYLENTVKGKVELEKLLPIPVLAEIPKRERFI